MGKCEFCGDECEIKHHPGNLYRYDCDSCGGYDLYGDEHGIIEEKYADKKHLIAGYLYEFNRNSEKYICIETDKILNDGRMPQSPMQRLERFLLNMYKVNAGFANKFGWSFGQNQGYNKYKFCSNNNMGSSIFYYPDSIAYAKHDEMPIMLDLLADLGYLKSVKHESYQITPKGFERAEQLLSTNIDSKSVFVAMWFDKDMDKIYENIIVPAIEQCGFKSVRVDRKEHNNNITDEIIAGIKQSKFIIADLTGHRNGVYYEAGFARGLGREVILTCRKDEFEKRHFDIAQINTIVWESDKLEEFKQAITKRIEATIL